MANAELKKNLIEGICSVVGEEEGLTKYELKTTSIQKDEENRIQIVAIGPMNDRPTKSVLLLGETGAGKTSIINAMVNHLFGVALEDNFRFQLKDYTGSDDKHQVDNQTEYITAYLIYHQTGMHFEGNCVLIDTPGFGDTKVPLEKLKVFLTKDFGLNNLNCIGLVAKANQNRILAHHIETFTKFTSILGNNVSGISKLLATFASDSDPALVEVMRHTGIQFTDVYRLDNWPLYVTDTVDLSEKSHHAYLQYKWNNMQAEYARFFEALLESSPVSLKPTRDLIEATNHLEQIKGKLKKNVKATAELVNTLRREKISLNQYEDQAKKITWKVQERKEHIEKFPVLSGFHVHNCEICQQTCTDFCMDPSGVTPALAGTGAGIGSATVTGIGSAITAGAVTGAEVGIFGGPIGVMVGGGIGTIIGLTTGLIVGLVTRKSYSKCPIASCGTCSRNKCTHDMADHEIQKEKYILSETFEEKINHLEKSKYDEITENITKLRRVIQSNEKALNDFKEKLTVSARDLVECTNKVVELSFGYKSLNPTSFIDEMITEERENSHHVELLMMLKNAVILMLGSVEN
ncbi:uncharacterized protein [Panulirus ornatus]